MNDGEKQHGDHIHNINRTRTKWTSRMCNDILTCREKAKALHSLDSCPRKANGMKVGIMDLCKMFWEEKGYGYLGKTAQNLRDKLGHIDKQVRINKACITDELNKQTEDNERRANVNNNSIHLENNQQNLQCNRQREELIQAHLNNTYQILKRKATSKFNQIIVTPGDWNQQDQNTFCKIKPNQEDMLKSIATELVTSDPKTQPMQYLWEANFAIYSVAYTWKTKHQKTCIIQQNRNKFKPKWMEHIEFSNEFNEERNFTNYRRDQKIKNKWKDHKENRKK